jgi:hypothetical protein
MAGTISYAHAVLIPVEEHWKYHIDTWVWDGERRKTYGIINSQIIIQNETVDKLEGFVADSNGTRLAIYDGEQVVMVRFLSESGLFSSKWKIAGRVHDGFFTIDIPREYRAADTVRIMIGNHEYTVNNGTPTTPQTWVFLNSAMLGYRTNPTLDQAGKTEVAEVQPLPISSVYSGGSLIDWILSQYGMLPVRSSDSSK